MSFGSGGARLGDSCLGGRTMWEGLSKNRYEHPQAGPASNHRLLSLRSTRSFASKAFAPPMCASLRPSMACEDFWTAHPTWFYSTSQERLFRDGLSNSTKMYNSHVSAAPNPQIADRIHLSLASKRVWGRAFRKCAEPWMAEPKRHTDVPKERFSEGPPPHPRPQATRQAPNNKYPS